MIGDHSQFIYFNFTLTENCSSNQLVTPCVFLSSESFYFLTLPPKRNVSNDRILCYEYKYGIILLDITWKHLTKINSINSMFNGATTWYLLAYITDMNIGISLCNPSQKKKKKKRQCRVTEKNCHSYDKKWQFCFCISFSLKYCTVFIPYVGTSEFHVRSKVPIFFHWDREGVRYSWKITAQSLTKVITSLFCEFTTIETTLLYWHLLSWKLTCPWALGCITTSDHTLCFPSLSLHFCQDLQIYLTSSKKNS